MAFNKELGKAPCSVEDLIVYYTVGTKMGPGGGGEGGGTRYKQVLYSISFTAL